MPVRVHITVTDGPDSGKTIEFKEGSVTVGRGRADLIVKDKKVSGHHCSFVLDGDDLYIEDFKSTNGTYIAGRKIQGRELVHNLDEIVIGLSKLSVAIVEQIEDFKQKNKPKGQAKAPQTEAPVQPTRPAPAVQPEPEETFEAEESQPPEESAPAVTLGELAEEEPASISATPAVESAPSGDEEEVELPPPDAFYRETGIRRIEDLISDEMNAFSKWDEPGVEEKASRGGAIPRVKVNLTMRKGPDQIPNHSCTKQVSTIGRKDVDIRMNDIDCSRKHAAIEIVSGEKVFLRDLASTNGTYVNGKRIAYQELLSGDLIQIGQTVFEVTIETAES